MIFAKRFDNHFSFRHDAGKVMGVGAVCAFGLCLYNQLGVLHCAIKSRNIYIRNVYMYKKDYMFGARLVIYNKPYAVIYGQLY